MLGPTAVIANKMEVPKEVKVIEKITYVDNPVLVEKLKNLEEENRLLKEQLEKSRPKVDIEKPTASRAIRG